MTEPAGIGGIRQAGKHCRFPCGPPRCSRQVRDVAHFSLFQRSDPTTWPHDSHSHVFLARAVDQIGRAKFGDKWVGDEAAVGIAFKQAPWNFVGLNEGPEKHDRFAQITRDIVKAAEEGVLLTALREELGGHIPRPLKAEIWNTEHYSEWFERCSKEEVTVNESMGRSYKCRYWIFIERVSLEHFMRKLCGPANLGGVQKETARQDRLPKRSPPLPEVMAWAEEIFSSKERMTRAAFEKLARERFEQISLPFVRNEIWPKRPVSWPRRSKKGA